MLRHETVYKQEVRMELFNIDWQRPKVLNTLKTKLDHGHSIFVEKNNLKETKFEELAWHKAITGE